MCYGCVISSIARRKNKTKTMSSVMQLVVPFLVALVVLGIFQLVAYLHIQLTDGELAEVEEDDSEEFSTL